MLAPTLLCAALAVASPSAPDYREIAAGDLVFHLDPSALGAGRRLIDAAPALLRPVDTDLGLASPLRVDVYLAGDHESYLASAPEGRAFPPWSVGVALSDRAEIYLTLRTREGAVADLDATFVHEYAHLALRAALPMTPLPRWFHEGFALFTAGESSLERATILARAALVDGVLPMRDLTDGFPESTARAELAYAQSADFLGFIRRASGDSLAPLVARMARGESFDDAVVATTGDTLAALEESWLDEFMTSYRWVPVIASGSTLWLLASVIFLVAYARRRHRNQRTLQVWAEQERREDEAIVALVAPAPPPPRTTHDPYDGRRPTLH